MLLLSKRGDPTHYHFNLGPSRIQSPAQIAKKAGCKQLTSYLRRQLLRVVNYFKSWNGAEASWIPKIRCLPHIWNNWSLLLFGKSFPRNHITKKPHALLLTSSAVFLQTAQFANQNFNRRYELISIYNCKIEAKEINNRTFRIKWISHFLFQRKNSLSSVKAVEEINNRTFQIKWILHFPCKRKNSLSSVKAVESLPFANYFKSFFRCIR